MILLVRPWEVETIWPSVEPELRRALVDTFHQTTDDLRRMCREDRAQLWVGRQFSAVTLVLDGEPRILHITALAGDEMEGWIDPLISRWREFARSHGCAKMIATGRPGWKRVFKTHGFAVTKITGVCEV